MWYSIVEKFEKKLSTWKRQYLSIGCRVNLIKSTLSNPPIYYMSLFKKPIGVMKRLHRIRRNLFWDGNCGKRKLHLMKWSVVVKTNAQKGLRLGSLAPKNRALLAKWWWRFGEEKGAIWRRVNIAFKFGDDERVWVLSKVSRYRRSW